MMAALLPQFFPYVLILIPFYVLMSNLNLVDTHVGLILTHTSLTLPFALWMLMVATSTPSRWNLIRRR